MPGVVKPAGKQAAKGRIALVIGAGSSGTELSNGRAIALQLARDGFLVAAADIRLESAAETVRQIGAEGSEGLAIACDVTDPGSVAAAVETSRSMGGRLAVLVNNVGIATAKPVAELDDQSWEHVLATNLSGAFRACRSVMPLMAASDGGSVINVSSVAAFRWLGSPYASYAASKSGLVGLSRNLALEYASRQVRVNCVLPGFIDTANAQANLAVDPVKVAEFRHARIQRCPMGRMGSVWDVAHAVAFLASDKARYITATELVVDGGLSAAA